MMVKSKKPKIIITNESDSMDGKGIIDNLKNLKKITTGEIGSKLINLLPSSDENARPLYKGEKHAVLKLPNGRFGMANYMGPGTSLVNRLKRGDPPRTMSDKVAQAHDIRYANAEVLDDIRKADNLMVRKIDEISKNKQDSRFNTSQAKLIKAKIIGEDLGLIKKDAFSGDLSLNKLISKNDKELIDNKLKKLEQEGFGGPAINLQLKALNNTKRKKPRSAVYKLKGSGERTELSLTKHVLPYFGEVSKLLGKNLILPIAGTILAAKHGMTGIKKVGEVSKNLARKILPFMFKKKKENNEMEGTGIINKHKPLLEKHLTDGIKKVLINLDRIEKGELKGSGIKLSGSGFFDKFKNIFKKIIKPIAKIGLPIASIVAPEIGVPLSIAGAVLDNV